MLPFSKKAIDEQGSGILFFEAEITSVQYIKCIQTRIYPDGFYDIKHSETC